MKSLFSSLRWMVFLVLVWIVALIPRWLDPALWLWAPHLFLVGELELQSRGWEGEEGARSRSYVTGTLRVPERGWELPYELDLDEATVDAAQLGQVWSMRVAPFPSPHWFEGKAVVARLHDPVGTLPSPESEILAAVRGPILALVLWVVFSVVEGIALARRRRSSDPRRATDLLEVEVGAPAPAGCAPVALGLGLALLVAAIAGWGAVFWVGLISIAGGSLGAHRGSVLVDRGQGRFQRSHELLLFRRSSDWQPFGRAVGVAVTTRRGNNTSTIAELELLADSGRHVLASGGAEGPLRAAAQRLGDFLGVRFDEREARGFGENVELREGAVFAGTPPPHLAHLAGPDAGPVHHQRSRTEAFSDAGSPASDPSPVSPGPPLVSVIGGEPAIPRVAVFGCLALLLLTAAVAVPVGVIGVEPMATALLEPEVATWPLGAELRGGAAGVLASQTSEESLIALLRFVHTSDPTVSAWPKAMVALERRLSQTTDTSAAAGARLRELDLAASRLLGRQLDPHTGVFAWWGVDPRWVELVGVVAGSDPAAALQAWHELARETDRGTETYLSELGAALGDPRPVPFVVEHRDGSFTGRAVAPDLAGGLALTVGDVLAIHLFEAVGYWPSSDTDPVGGWRELATARGYPYVDPALAESNG